MDFKKFVSGAGTAINRAVQKTEETFLQAEKTEYDPYFLELCRKCDLTQQWTESLVKEFEAFAEPNPANRVENILNEKLDRKQSERMNGPEELGNAMMKAGGDLGLDTDYGKHLMTAGQSEIYVGRAQKQLSTRIVSEVTTNMRNFLTTDLKTMQTERKTLENLRLDLDLAKNKLKKAKSEHDKQTSELEMKKSQGDFDDQLVIAKLHMEGVKNVHSQHLELVKKMLCYQMEFYAECHKIMQDLTSKLDLA